MKKYILPFLKIITLLLFPVITFSQTSFSNSPGTVQNQPYDYCMTCSGAKWINTGNVGYLDNQFCSATLQPYLNCYHDQCYWSRYLDCHNFGFTIPSDALILGIQLDISGLCDKNETIMDSEISLMKNSVVTGSNQALAGYWPIVNSVRIYGGVNELWDYSWSPAEIDSGTFGVFIKVKNMTSLIPTINIDNVSMSVTYQLATGIYNQTASSSSLYLENNPNATELTVNFAGNESKTAKLDLYNILGKKCYCGLMKKNQEGLFQEMINTAELKNGIYFINVYCDNKLYSRKFTITK